MEEDFYHSDFADLIKEKADQYRMYPSDRVWKNIDRSLRSRRKWYWAGFVLLLSGISYISIVELMKPPQAEAPGKLQSAPATEKNLITTQQLNPFATTLSDEAPKTSAADSTVVTSNITVEDSGAITAAFDIPLQIEDPLSPTGKKTVHGSLLIEGLEPLAKNEVYNIELSLPPANKFLTPAEAYTSPAAAHKIEGLDDLLETSGSPLNGKAARKLPPSNPRHISWQLAFSPTTNFRKLNGTPNAKLASSSGNLPMALQISGDINTLVHHTPALGFELGNHAFISLSDKLSLKAGLQFNYSKYDIRAYRNTPELATISLIPSAGRSLNSLTSYTDIRNFGGSSVYYLKNQYFQLSMPVGLELKVLGNDRVQLDIAGTLQPTYLLNKNTYLITTDYKNYVQEPSLVRRWNMNAGAEAYLSYNHNGVKWQVGPQFRYQLFSSYNKAYPSGIPYGIRY